MKYFKPLLCIVMMLFAFLPLQASEEQKEGLDLQGILFGHIQDSYEWHIMDIGDKAVVIPLPVIVKTSSGWRMFCSSEFEHHADAEGLRHGPDGLSIATKGDHEGRIVENGEPVLDISITKTVVVLFIDAILLLLCVLIPARWCRKHKIDDPAPKGFTGFMHMFIMYVYHDIIESILGKEAPKYAPYLLTCFFFIFVANVMGVMPFPPGGGNLTGNIACTLFLAFCTFVITNVTGTKEYWKEIFWPDVPLFLKAYPAPVMPIIELFGVFTKPFALMIRLFANMMAGHAVMLSFTCVIFLGWSMGVGFGLGLNAFSIIMLLFMNLLELLVAFVQAYVFTMLSAVFIGLAHKEHGEE